MLNMRSNCIFCTLQLPFSKSNNKNKLQHYAGGQVLKLKRFWADSNLRRQVKPHGSTCLTPDVYRFAASERLSLSPVVVGY